MGGTLPIPRQTTKLHRLQKNLSQWWQTLSRPLQSSNLTNVNERKGTTYISTSSCLRSEQKPIMNSDSDSEVRIFACFVLDPCGSACCATSLYQTYPRRSSTWSTALAASCPLASYSAGSPSKQVSAPETHPSPVAYSYSYIVVAYSASWSSYCSRASFHSWFSWRSYISPYCGTDTSQNPFSPLMVIIDPEPLHTFFLP